MNIKKVSIAGLAGGVVSFLLGWLIYGMLMKDYYATNTNQSTMRAEADMIWWAMIAFNLAWGVFFAYLFSRWANIFTLSAGVYAGAKINFMLGITMSLSFWAMTTMYNNLNVVFVDIAINVIMGAVVGGVVGFVLGKLKD